MKISELFRTCFAQQIYRTKQQAYNHVVHIPINNTSTTTMPHVSQSVVPPSLQAHSRAGPASETRSRLHAYQTSRPELFPETACRPR